MNFFEKIINGLPAVALVLIAIAPANAQFTQQWTELRGSGAVGQAQQGESVAISADGNTAIVGGPGDNGGAGAVWVFTRSGLVQPPFGPMEGVWTQQGPKLVGSGAVGQAWQGAAVAISGDGNTVIVGGHGDENYRGALWVFTRDNGIWTQQGPKLVPVSDQPQWYSTLALSADGNIALIGRPAGGDSRGEAVIFARSGGTWTQRSKLAFTTDSPYGPNFGRSVSLSGAGNLALVGGSNDWEDLGAAWIFARVGNNWQQQGPKLVGSYQTSDQMEGTSVALSADGSTAMFGGWETSWVFTCANGVWREQAGWLPGGSLGLSGNGNVAVVFPPYWWMERILVYTRTNGVWSQQASPGLYVPGKYNYGKPIAISADGKTIIAGSPDLNDGNPGSAWVFEAQPVTSGLSAQWTRIAVPVGVPGGVTRDGSDRNLEAAAYGTFLSGGSTFAIAGRGGNIITWNGSAIVNRVVSADGFNGLAFSDDRAAVAVGDNGRIYRSTDGVQWSGQQVNNKQFKGVAYGGSRIFVAVQAGGRIFRSNDSGQRWQESSNLGQPWTTKDLNAVAYGDGLFVIAGSGPTILVSADAGITWRPITLGWDTPVTNLPGVAFGHGYFVAVAENGAVFESASGAIDDWGWEFVGPAGSASPLYGISYGSWSGQEHFIAVGKGGAILDGWFRPFISEPEAEGPVDVRIAWSRSSFPTTLLKGVAFGAGRFVAVGSGATIVQTKLLPW